ncbi:hypothetical protein P0Y35_06435 [Kiritimatiellaeota bacterium B1221]|nr:hypothetical protein [Kiritimatiellaeota bacterium B1221]
MKKLILFFIMIFLWIGTLVYFIDQENESYQELEEEVLLLRDEITVLGAEKNGLEQANIALHRQLAMFRATPPRQGPVEPVPPIETEEAMNNNQAALDRLEFEDVNARPLPAATAPSISPQMRKMMAQFPGQVTEESISKNNTIQDYFDANPQLVEERKKHTGKYGAGIEEVMKAYPDLAEKVKENEALTRPEKDL